MISRVARLAVLDGSGTLVDSGVYAPAIVFQKIFEERKVPITMAEAREPMGHHKKVHIQKLLENSDIRERWKIEYNKYPVNQDLNNMFERYQKIQLDVLQEYGTPITGAFDACKILKEQYNMKLGFSTGFTREMVNCIMDKNKELYNLLDATVAADEVGRARPAPFMVYKNMMQLDIDNPMNVVKIDDTEMGVMEGLNARCWTIGLINHSNLMGLLESELEELKKDDRQFIHRQILIRNKFEKLGAHYVTESLADVPLIIGEINKRLAKGEMP